jgi:hypothetical protein
MAKRKPNQNQIQFCEYCKCDTEHSAWSGPKSEYEEISGSVDVTAPSGKGKKQVYQHVRRCDVCQGSFCINYEILADTYRGIIKELESLRKLKADIQNLVSK